jgi:hypothetical protein
VAKRRRCEKQTARQLEIYEFIRAAIDKRGISSRCAKSGRSAEPLLLDRGEFPVAGKAVGVISRIKVDGTAGVPGRFAQQMKSGMVDKHLPRGYNENILT